MTCTKKARGTRYEGWISDSTDGTCNQTVLMLTGVVVGGGNAVYSYSMYTGPPPAVGMKMTVTGFTNPANNVTGAMLTAVDLVAKTVTIVAQMSQSTETPVTATGIAGGGGTIKVQCFYNGTNWVPMGNSSSPFFTAPKLGNATALSMLATGTVDGTMPVTVTASSPITLGGTYQSGYSFNQSAGGLVIYNLPSGSIVAGQSYCIANSNNGSGPSTSQLKLVPSSTTRIIFTNGMLTTSMTGHLQSGGAAGDEICVVSITSSLWQVTGTPRGSWSKF